MDCEPIDVWLPSSVAGAWPGNLGLITERDWSS